MKHNNSFIFNYQIVETKSFEVNLEDLATTLIEYHVAKDAIELPPIDTMIEDFGDNIGFYLMRLGFPEEAEIDEYDYDYFYNSIYDDLSTILQEKLYNQQ